jgi:hypothetical protein
VRAGSVVALAAVGLWPASRAEAQLGDRIKINGYASVEFEKQSGDEGKGDPNGSFDSDGVDLVVNVLATDRLRVGIDLTWEHGAVTEEGRGNVAVEYAFMEYFVRDWLKLRAGKMFVPFGLYNEIHTAKPLFLSVKEPFATDKTDKLGSPLRFFPRWGTGLAALGSGQIAGRDYDYTLQLSNGESVTVNPFEKDDNTAKALAARFRFHPTKGLAVGASAYRDELSPEDAAVRNTTQVSWSLHGSWEGSHAGVEGMYVHGSLEPDTRPQLSREGVEAMVWGKFGRLRPYLRYEYHDPDTGLDEDQAQMALGGVNVRIDDGFYLKAEIDRTTSGDLNPKIKGVAFNEFKASLAVGF